MANTPVRKIPPRSNSKQRVSDSCQSRPQSPGTLLSRDPSKILALHRTPSQCRPESPSRSYWTQKPVCSHRVLPAFSSWDSSVPDFSLCVTGKRVAHRVPLKCDSHDSQTKIDADKRCFLHLPHTNVAVTVSGMGGHSLRMSDFKGPSKFHSRAPQKVLLKGLSPTLPAGKKCRPKEDIPRMISGDLKNDLFWTLFAGIFGSPP